MVSPVTVFLASGVTVFWLAVNGLSEDMLSETAQNDSERLRSFLIEDLKFRILKGLNMAEPPTERVGKPLSKDVIQLLQEEEPVSETEKENLIVHAINRDFNCVRSNGTTCHKFQFNVSSDLESVISVHAWFHKKTQNLTLSIYSSPDEDAIVKLKEDSSKINAKLGWIKFELPKQLTFELEDNHLHCTVEIEGSDVELVGEKSPFLVITKHTKVLERKKRFVTPSSTGNCTCCADNLSVTLEDIGWQNWVHFPKDFNVKVCRGECIENLSSVTLSYQWVLHSFYKINSTYPKPKCTFWTPKCKPDKYSSLRMIYKGKDGDIDQVMAGMLIESCRCM